VTADNLASTRLRQIKPLEWAVRLLIAAAHLYCVGVCGWAALHLLFGDRWWWLFLLNSLAVYLFAPLPLLLAPALTTRRREVWVGFGVVLALGAYFYGRLLLPKFLPGSPPGPTISVMTYNVLGANGQTAQVEAAIRASDADVIALQELNPPIAEAIRRDLAAEYPYQVLDPQPGVAGLGVISRYPLHPTDAVPPGIWVGTPQVLDLTFGDTAVTLVNFHAIPPGSYAPAILEYTTREREQQARTLAALAAARSGPLIVPGDLNASDCSTAYAIVTSVLVDPWRAAGWGLGHTFPGAASFGSSRPTIAGIPVPMWLVRIDYVFHSADWQPMAARVGPWDGVSDHRPVVVELALARDAEGTKDLGALP
jgi:vancomycin resistance protein VanJ